MAYHVFEQEQVVDRPLTEVFSFFSQARNLEALTPASMRFRFETPPPERMEVGTEVVHRLRVGGLPVRWVTRIVEWDPPHRFADLQARGPYAYWLHTHSFESLPNGRTLMRDHIVYRVPLGPIGEVARLLYIERQLRSLFDYRRRVLARVLPGVVVRSPPGRSPS